MRNGYHKGLNSLSREGSSTGIGNGTADHYRNIPLIFLLELVYGKKGGFGIEGVKNSFDQQHIYSTCYQGFHLRCVSFDQLVKSNCSIPRVIDIGRHTGRSVGRPYRSGNESRFVRIFRRSSICHFPRYFRRLKI